MNRPAAVHDVIVLGSGAAGLLAAIEAHDLGASAVVIERESQTGGSTRLSGGYVVLCQTDLQDGTAHDLLEDLRSAHRRDAADELSELYVREAPAVYRRLTELGFGFGGTMQFAHMSRPWAHEPPTGRGVGGGAQILEVLEAAARSRRIPIVLGTAGRRLRTEGSGRVVGVEVEDEDGTYELSALRGVVVATGGFTRSPELVKGFGPMGAERIVPATGPGSVGEGLKMCLALGAATSYIGMGIAPTAPIEPSTGEGFVVFYAGGIILNKEGRRFHDESAVYTDISSAGLLQTDGLMIQVYDAAIREHYETLMIGERMIGGVVHSAETLSDLFAGLQDACGLDAAAAKSTVRSYNEYVALGDDRDLGRTNLVGTAGDLVPIATPPFHAAVTVPGTTHFNGGVAVCEDMHVTDVFGESITGLYAAGEVTGGFHGAGYMSGTSMGMALIFGRVAGRSAARGAVAQ